MKLLFLLALIQAGLQSTTLAQDAKMVLPVDLVDAPNLVYAYILVEGKAFSQKLKVKVDFGDDSEQLEIGKQYSKVLSDKKSYAAILNYMSEREFELVETRDYMFTFQGTGETSGIIFIMRKTK